MSLSALTTIAAARDSTAQGARPTKSDVGAVHPAHTDAGADAKLTDVLAKQIPTELIAPYTAIMAAIVGAVAKPTKAKPHPDLLSSWRWTAFILLLVSVVALVWVGTWQKTGKTDFPVIPVLAGGLAAMFWAFLIPGSPLDPYLHSKHAHEFVPLFFALAGTVVAGVTAALLTAPKT